MKGRSIFLGVLLGGAAGLISGCASAYVPPKFSSEWKFGPFNASAKEQKGKPEEGWIWLYPPFYLEAAQAFSSVGRDEDTVIVYCTDSTDYSSYRYCLVRAGEVIKQCQFRLPKRI